MKIFLFSVFTSHVIKTKIVTIQWIKSRMWDKIDDWYINNQAKNQVSAAFHSRIICRIVSPKFIELCMETPCLCPSEVHKHLSNRNICHRVLPLKQKIIALELRHIERKVSSSASTVQLAKTKMITHLGRIKLTNSLGKQQLELWTRTWSRCAPWNRDHLVHRSAWCKKLLKWDVSH